MAEIALVLLKLGTIAFGGPAAHRAMMGEGWMGAVVATVGIFLPGFLLVAARGPLVPRLRKSAVAVAALDGVVAGSLALMAVVAIQLGKASIVDRTTLIVVGLSLVALLRLRANSAWIVAGAAAVGWLIR